MRRSALTTFICLAALVIAPPGTPPARAAEEGAISLSLSEAVARALENNLDIAVERLAPRSTALSIDTAEAAFSSRFDADASYTDATNEPTSRFSSVGQEFKSARLSWTDPNQRGGTLTTSLQYNESDTQFPPGSVEQFGLVPTNISTTLTLSYTQSLLRNFGLSINRTAIEQARLSLRISEERFADRVMLTVEQVESAYWDLVGAIRNVEVARTSLELARDFLEQTRIRVEVGTLAPIEITTAEAEVASREEGVIVAENGVRDAEDALRALMRVPPGSDEWSRPIRPTDEPVFQPVEVDLDRAVADALERRASVKQAELDLRSSELGERFRRNQVRWDLRATGSYSVSGNNFETEFIETTVIDPVSGLPVTIVDDQRVFGGRSDAFTELGDRDNDQFSVQLALTIPVGNKQARADYARARIEVEQRRLALEQVRQQVTVEVRRAVRALETNARRVASARANLVQQRKKVEAEQKRYENGLSTAFQVLEFQKDLRDAEFREISAIVDYSKALASLARVRGTLLAERGIRVDSPVPERD